MKILVIRFSSIGDIVLTSPVVRALNEQLGAEVHFVTKRAFRDLVIENPNIHKVFLFENDFSALIQELKAEAYDLVVDLHKNLRSLRLKKALGVKAYQFDKINWQKWMAVHVSKRFLPDLHLVDRYFKSLGDIGIKPDGKGLDYFLPSNFRQADEVQYAIGDLLKVTRESHYVVMAPFAAHRTKSIPEQVIHDMLSNIDKPVVLLGGPGDREMLESIAGRYQHVISLAGISSLHGSAAVIRDADLAITADTGMMHISVAFKRPLLSIWGSTIPEFGMFPYYVESNVYHRIFEVSGLSCRPCSKIGYQKCPKGHFRCMMDQDTEEIVHEIRKFFEKDYD